MAVPSKSWRLPANRCPNVSTAPLATSMWSQKASTGSVHTPIPWLCFIIGGREHKNEAGRGGGGGREGRTEGGGRDGGREGGREGTPPPQRVSGWFACAFSGARVPYGQTQTNPQREARDNRRPAAKGHTHKQTNRIPAPHRNHHNTGACTQGHMWTRIHMRPHKTRRPWLFRPSSRNRRSWLFSLYLGALQRRSATLQPYHTGWGLGAGSEGTNKFVSLKSPSILWPLQLNAFSPDHRIFHHSITKQSPGPLSNPLTATPGSM